MYKVVEGLVSALPTDAFVTFSKHKRQIKQKTFGDCVTINPVEKHKTNNSKCLSILNSRTAQYQNSFFVDTVIRWNLDQIILSLRKPFLSFYIYLLLIWHFMFIFIFLCCFLTTERVYGKIREIATFLEVLEFRSIFTFPLHFGSKTRFDWSKSFEWLRRRCQHRLKRWPIKMGFRWVIWAIVYGGPQALVSSQKYARYVPKIPQGRTHSYYPCHFNHYFPCQNVDRTQIAY